MNENNVAMNEVNVSEIAEAAANAVISRLLAAGQIRQPGASRAAGTGTGKVGRPRTVGLDAWRDEDGKPRSAALVQRGTGWTPTGAGAPSKELRDNPRCKALTPYTPAQLGLFHAGGPLGGLSFNVEMPDGVILPRGFAGVMTPRRLEAHRGIVLKCAPVLEAMGLDGADWLPEPVQASAEPVAEPVAEPAPKSGKRK